MWSLRTSRPMVENEAMLRCFLSAIGRLRQPCARAPSTMTNQAGSPGERVLWCSSLYRRM